MLPSDFNLPKGTILLEGKGKPSLLLGKRGDYYLDTVGAMLYGPKRFILWPTGIKVTLRRKGDVADDLPLASRSGLVLETKSGAALMGDRS